MACQVTLFSLLGDPLAPLPPRDTGGTWQFTSGAASATFNVDGAGDATYLASAQIGVAEGGDLTTLDVSGTSAGVYVFTYTVGDPCTDTATVTITVNDGALPLLNYTPTRCSSANIEYSLIDFVAGGDGSGTGVLPIDTDGVWTGDTSGPGYTAGATTPITDTFNPFGLDAGTYSFTYTVDHSNGEEPGCENCIQISQIDITVTDAAEAGTDGTATLCNSQP